MIHVVIQDPFLCLTKMKLFHVFHQFPFILNQRLLLYLLTQDGKICLQTPSKIRYGCILSFYVCFIVQMSFIQAYSSTGSYLLSLCVHVQHFRRYHRLYFGDKTETLRIVGFFYTFVFVCVMLSHTNYIMFHCRDRPSYVVRSYKELHDTSHSTLVQLPINVQLITYQCYVTPFTTVIEYTLPDDRYPQTIGLLPYSFLPLSVRLFCISDTSPSLLILSYT